MASEPSLRDPGAHMPQPVPYETSARRLNVYHIPTRSSVSGLMLFSPHYLLSFLSSVLTPSFLESPYKHFSFIKVPVRCQNIPALSLLSLTQPLNLVSLGYHLFDTSAFSLPWLPMLLLRNDRFLLSQWFFIKTQIQKIRLLSKYFKTVSSKKPRLSFALRFPATIFTPLMSNDLELVFGSMAEKLDTSDSYSEVSHKIFNVKRQRKKNQLQSQKRPLPEDHLADGRQRYNCSLDMPPSGRVIDTAFSSPRDVEAYRFGTNKAQ